MKYLLAAVLLISTALAYPVGENEGEQHQASVPLVISDYASVAKSDESGEVHSHEHHVEVHSDVSHEHGSPKVEHDSHESSDESTSAESGEKPQDQAKPEQAVKPSLDEKVEHQAQPSEIVNSEVAQHVQDPVKVVQPKSVEPVPQSDSVQGSEQEHVKIADAVQPSPNSAQLSDPVETAKHADEPQAQQEGAKPSDELPKTVAEPEAPTLKTLSDQQSAQADVKQDGTVVQSDSVDIIQPKSAEAPELKESTEGKKAADEPVHAEAPKLLLVDTEKLPEDKAKSALPQEIIPAANPVHDDVVKPVQEVAADALPLPQSDTIPKEEPSKAPEPETLPEKSLEKSASS